MSNYKPDLKGIITRQTLAAGDTCYLLMTEGNDKILELFDCKYSPLAGGICAAREPI